MPPIVVIGLKTMFMTSHKQRYSLSRMFKDFDVWKFPIIHVNTHTSMFKYARLGHCRLLHRCYLGALGLSFSTHSRILFSSEYFHYKIFTLAARYNRCQGPAVEKQCVRGLKNTSVFSSNWKWRDALPSKFWYLTDHLQIPPDLWNGAAVHDQKCTCVHWLRRRTCWHADMLTLDKQQALSRYVTRKLYLKVLYPFSVKYYIVQIFVFELNVWIKLKNHSFSDTRFYDFFFRTKDPWNLSNNFRYTLCSGKI
jgi:hypothetical protein